MVELWIDEQRCDIGELPTLPIDFDIANLTKVEGAREGRTLELKLPPTPANSALFDSSHDLNGSVRFNLEHHTARLEKDGVKIFEGTVYLLDTEIEDGVATSYSIRIKEGGAEWIENVVHGSVADLDIPFSGKLNLATIDRSWDWENGVSFLPVYRGNYRSYYTGSVLPVERVLLSDDYHPFISIRDMVREMFAKSGYRLRSDFLDSELGRSLYMSGDYSRTDNALAKERCNFFARRAQEGVDTADYIGRVYASRAFAAHTVGPIVDTVDPDTLDDKGRKMSDCFCKNDCFKLNSAGNICFEPPMAVRVGFLLHLEYTTDFKILSRTRLRGFDMVEGLYGERVEIELANAYPDWRDNLSTGFQYRVLVFDHTENRQYQLEAKLHNGVMVVLHNWASRSSLMVTPEKKVHAASLFYRDDESGPWLPYTQDWAMYNGYVNETGSTDVVMDFRLSPQEVSAGESLVLDKFWFGGAEPGMTLKVRTGTSLQPYFTSVPGYNSEIEFRDIAPRIRQVELLTALGEMFNLAFYTDRARKEVHIEPLESFYADGGEVDWSSRIDYSGGVRIIDSGIDLPQNTVLTYLDTDIASHEFNTEEGTTLGRWRFRNPLYGTIDSTKTLGNKLFTTTLNATGILGSAPSASILQVGDRGEEVSFETAFTPRIVCYKGLQELPKGETWGASYRLTEFPYASFVDEESINLCFEDRNGIEGLHRYHLPSLLRQRDCRRVTLDLRLTTAEIASLFTADGSKPSLRTRFRFNIQGVSQPFRLVGIKRWDLKSNIVQCTFEQELNNLNE